jgi:hypothetical protein
MLENPFPSIEGILPPIETSIKCNSRMEYNL